ncbi:hypothetical protein BH09MYX1_BH09MYX1_32650 [soil metagenome]
MSTRAWLLFAAVVACSSDPTPVPVDACATLEATFPSGGTGHADPYGAKAANQARAGRLSSAAMLTNAPDARQRAAVGDFVLVNDKISAVIEDKGPSDGYAPFGGELIAVDVVGEDGRPKGTSRWGETLFDFAAETILPESVSVLADGSDGKEAIVRVVGKLTLIPFLERFAPAFGQPWKMPVAYDYVLAPGSSKIVLRVTLAQNQPELRVATGMGGTTMGLFHSSRAQLFTENDGFDGMKSPASWLGYDAGEASYALRFPKANAGFGIDVSGFLYVYGADRDLEACKVHTFDMAEIVVGGPGIDGLRQTIRALDGLPEGRTISGVVEDGGGIGAAGVRVHAIAKDGKMLSRVVTDGTGAYAIHVPAEAVTLVTYAKGYAAVSIEVDASMKTADLALAPSGFIHVKTHDVLDTTRAVPVRVQVIPTVAVAATSPSFGTLDEANGRLWQDFAVTGDSLLAVPPGEHDVIVSRGYEWELVEAKVTVTAGSTVEVDAPMSHSVDSTGVMCADFHIHSFYSADSQDPVEHKVKGAIADGLEAPFSSEHEWVVDFGPVVKKLGLEDWAFGGASEELTTFTWGHFGVVPLSPKPDAQNNGAVDWVGKDPKEVFAIVNALPEKPVLVVNHPRGQSIAAYFDAAEFDRDKLGSTSKLWSEDFAAIEVTNDSSFDANRTAVVADWLALLKAGKTMWAVGSSDSHSIRTSPVGYPRTCLRFGHDDPRKLSPEAVRDALRAGHATISGGLYMTVKGPNGEGPGDTVANASGTMSFTVDVAAPTWVDASELEVIVDGVTVSTVPLAPKTTTAGRAWQNVVAVEKKSSGRGFVVFHARGKGDLAPLHPGRVPFAYSNPVFF